MKENDFDGETNLHELDLFLYLLNRTERIEFTRGGDEKIVKKRNFTESCGIFSQFYLLFGKHP